MGVCLRDLLTQTELSPVSSPCGEWAHRLAQEGVTSWSLSFRRGSVVAEIRSGRTPGAVTRRYWEILPGR